MVGSYCFCFLTYCSPFVLWGYYQRNKSRRVHVWNFHFFECQCVYKDAWGSGRIQFPTSSGWEHSLLSKASIVPGPISRHGPRKCHFFLISLSFLAPSSSIYTISSLEQHMNSTAMKHGGCYTVKESGSSNSSYSGCSLLLVCLWIVTSCGDTTLRLSMLMGPNVMLWPN